ncbi:MAG: serine/threonine-protein kinase [Vicinamibacterales bacterium]
MLPADSPDRIGRYELHGLLARGGMGRLYLARDPNTGRLVVIKLMDATLDSAELRDRFDREARSLASLSHPNIIHIYDYGDFKDSPFIAMEFVRGETLEERIKRRSTMTVPHKLRLLTELCSGLAHAHEAGIIHRDVKPANLMVDLDERLRILDFGIARVADSNLTRMINPSEGFGPTQIGTLGYMSPEQTQGGEIDRRTDVFAVGAVAYELFSYVPAFTGATTRELEASVLRAQPMPLTTRVPGLDPEIDAIVRTALSRDPKDRYKDAAALGQALERCRARLDPVGAQSMPARSAHAAPAAGASASVRAGSAYVRAVAAFKEQATDSRAAVRARSARRRSRTHRCTCPRDPDRSREERASGGPPGCHACGTTAGSIFLGSTWRQPAAGA